MAKRKRKPKTLADMLRDAVRDSGLTHYRIGKDAGIGADQVTRFVQGRDIRIGTAAKIINALGLTISIAPKQGK